MDIELVKTLNGIAIIKTDESYRVEKKSYLMETLDEAEKLRKNIQIMLNS